MTATTEIATPFSKVLAAIRLEAGVFRVAASDDWRQGRTLFGGISAALALAVAERAHPDLPPLRAAQFSFIGPATGELELTPEILRRGKSTAFLNVHGRSASETALQATLTYGASRRSSHCFRALPAPDVSRPDELPEFFDAPFAPRFAQHFEGRLAGGSRAVSGAAKPEILLWLRHRDPAAPDALASIIALGDVPPPAAMTMFSTPAPISTVSWSLDVLTERFSGTGWHLIHVEAETVGGGYSSQHMTLWDQAGDPVLAARQTVAVFG